MLSIFGQNIFWVHFWPPFGLIIDCFLGISGSKRPKQNPPQNRLESLLNVPQTVWSHWPFWTDFAHFQPLFGAPLGPKTAQNVAKRAPGDQKPPLTVCLRHSEGWKPLKVGVCTWGKCSQNRNLVRLGRDMAVFLFFCGQAYGQYALKHKAQ